MIIINNNTLICAVNDFHFHSSFILDGKEEKITSECHRHGFWHRNDRKRLWFMVGCVMLALFLYARFDNNVLTSLRCSACGLQDLSLSLFLNFNHNRGYPIFTSIRDVLLVDDSQRFPHKCNKCNLCSRFLLN